jgi:TRAP-type uncharacterized transport system substrate-binding protein
MRCLHEESEVNMLSRRYLLQLAALIPLFPPLHSADVHAQAARGASPRRGSVQDSKKEEMNAWTVGLAGGLLEGAPLRLAAEIARVVDDGPNLHVLPIVTRGATENLNSLLYLRGVDTAIINSDALEEYKVQVPEIRRRITYLLNLFPSELHVFVRPEIASLQDLAGKRVNFNTQGTAAAYSGPMIFSRLGINAEKTFIPHQIALEQMRKGEMAAVVFITSKPVDAFVKGRWEPGFKFLAVNYDGKFEDYYLPAVLEATEYPGLIKQGERVSTIAVPTALVAFNWSAKSNRYQRVARFTDMLFSRIDRLQAPGFDPKWKSINLAATVPGLDRFAAAQEWLDRQAWRSKLRAGSPWRRARPIRSRICAPARCWGRPSGWNVWTDCRAISPRRFVWRGRTTAGSSARPPRRSIMRRS